MLLRIFTVLYFLPSLAFSAGTAISETLAQVKSLPKSEIKAHFQKIDLKVRAQILANARVMKPVAITESAKPLLEDEKDNNLNKIDIVNYLSETCGFNYFRNEAGIPIRPEVECTYQPRDVGDEFKGITAKFDCKFEIKQANGETASKTMKVKYDHLKQPGGGSKEVPQGVIGGLTARLLGFHSPTFCPVNLICNDCPNDDPWNKSKQSTGPAASGSRVIFKDVVVAVNPNGFKVVGQNNDNKSMDMGFYFKSELNRIFPSDKALAAQFKVEREALALWVNFADSRDAGWHNTKLVCSEVDAHKESGIKCLHSIAFFNDYGNSFGHYKQTEKIRIDRFTGNIPLMQYSNRNRDEMFSGPSEAVTAGANGSAEAKGVAISKAGQTLFVKNAESITDQQWSDIFNLAQMDVVSNAKIGDWIAAFKRKIREVKDLNLK